MPWYNTSGAEGDIALCTKISYIRNPITAFGDAGDPKERERTSELISSLLASSGFSSESFAPTESIEPLALCERGFVPYFFAAAEKKRSAYFNEPCSLAVAVGGESYLAVSAILSGVATEECRNIAAAAEELLDQKLSVAFSEKLGYLSPTISHIGSGAIMRAILFLPSTVSDGDCLHTSIASSIGAYLSPIGKESGLYALSYSPSLSVSEDRAVAFFDQTVKKIIAEERRAYGIISDHSRKIIIEKAWRAYGILSFARELGETELLELLRDLRAPLVTGGGNELPPVSIRTCNELTAFGGNASVALAKGCKTQEECSVGRAQLVKELISPAETVAESAEKKGVEKKNGK